MNVLAVGAHFDDVELGCGGTLAKHARAGDRVIVFIATSSEFSDKEGRILREGNVALSEAECAGKEIGYQLVLGRVPTFCLEYGEEIHGKLIKLIEENHIDIIYTHWTHDVHHDHRNLALSTLHVARHVNRLLMYRSNWYVSEQGFVENFYVDITNTWEIKEKALRAYDSELKRVGGSWINYFRQEAMNNGMKMGVKYAEAFQVVKWLQ